jgi:hypothetical protein
VNREFRPLLRMTFPQGISDLTAAWKPSERLFRSWLLLAGIFPIDYDDVVFEEVEPGRRFLERSSLLTQRVWEHERTIESTPALLPIAFALCRGCRGLRGSTAPSLERCSGGAIATCVAYLARRLPNKALQLTRHSVLQSCLVAFGYGAPPRARYQSAGSQLSARSVRRQRSGWIPLVRSSASPRCR